MNQTQRKEYIHTVANELEDYFYRHARASDLENITNWWLARNRLQHTPKLIQEALNELLQANKIGKRTYQGREIFERLSVNERQQSEVLG